MTEATWHAHMCQEHTRKKSNRSPHLHGAYILGARRREEASQPGVPDDGEGRAEKGLQDLGQGGDFSVKRVAD